MISLNIQKKIMWIPFVNCINILTFPFNLPRVKIGSRAWWMMFVYYVGSFAVGFALLNVVLSLLPAGSPIFAFCNVYTIPFCVNFGIIKYQEKYSNR